MLCGNHKYMYQEKSLASSANLADYLIESQINYLLLNKLMPAQPNRNQWLLGCCIGDNVLLHVQIKVICKSSYTSTIEISQRLTTVWEAAKSRIETTLNDYSMYIFKYMTIRLYHDAQCVEVLSTNQSYTGCSGKSTYNSVPKPENKRAVAKLNAHKFLLDLLHFYLNEGQTLYNETLYFRHHP